jgi:hypothetical protein
VTSIASNLPIRNDEKISLGGLWEALNNQSRFPTPQSTIDATIYAVKSRGVDALKEPANIERLSSCDAAAKAEIERRVAKLMGAS